MFTASFISFLFLSLSFLSLWITKSVRVWGTLLVLSLFGGMVSGNILWPGIVILGSWSLLWFTYVRVDRLRKILFYVSLIILSYGFVFHLFPGFNPIVITDQFKIGLEKPLIGLFPLALLVPLARTGKDWRSVFKGLLFGLIGIGIIAILGLWAGVVHWHYKLPSYPTTRYWSNLVLIAIPEEGFYRGFIQNELAKVFKKRWLGNGFALFFSTIIFTVAHLFWSPSLDVLGFVFIASLLYGATYIYSGRIESAILCHFLLNFFHMTFFSYHAM